MTWHVFIKELKDSIRDRKTIMLSVMLPILFNIGLLFLWKRSLWMILLNK